MATSSIPARLHPPAPPSCSPAPTTAAALRRPGRCHALRPFSTSVDVHWSYKGTVSSMYRHQPPFERGSLDVSGKHCIYYESFGNPDGKPAVFLHGGPGAGCVPRHAGFFDPLQYRVTLFDQRGCGKSTPRGCLEENTTWDLVEDIEKLRKHLRVNKWLVMGGSWGVTLALAYAQAHPNAVSEIILRGVCMLRAEEIDWFYKKGANLLFPFAWEELLSLLDPSERTIIIPAFYKRLTSDDESVRAEAARAWLKWEMGLSFFSVSETVFAWDGKEYSVQSLDVKKREKEVPARQEDRSKYGQGNATQPSVVPAYSAMTSQVAQARLECHYFHNAGFLREGQLLEGVPKIRHIPCVIVQGRYDFVCPIKNAFDLHRSWPEAKLRIVSNAGHSMYEKGIMQELLAATDAFKQG